MSNNVGTHAVLVDREGRFMTFVGRVIRDGQVMKLKDHYDVEFYNKRKLVSSVQQTGMRLVFIDPAARLPVAPRRVLKGVFRALKTARLDEPQS